MLFEFPQGGEFVEPPSAGLEAPLRPDAILPSYARQIADSISVLRLYLLVRCIGPTRSPPGRQFFNPHFSSTHMEECEVS